MCPSPTADQPLRTPICFLDETGALHAGRDAFFVVGMVKSHRPEVLSRAIQLIRDRAHFYEEMKWANVDDRQRYLAQYEEVIAAFFGARTTSFSCYVLDKRQIDPVSRFGNLWRAYEELAALEVAYNTHDDELVTVLADHMSTPANVDFEGELRRAVGDRGKMIGGVLRVDSKGVSLVQLADVLMGAVAYSYKLDAGLIPSPSVAKVHLAEVIRSHVGAARLCEPIKTAKFRVTEYR